MFARAFTGETGINSLMDELGQAINGGDIKYMFGGGNPAEIPEVDDLIHQIASNLVLDKASFSSMIRNYDTPKGNAEFIDLLVQYFRSKHDWPIDQDNIVISNGSQQAIFTVLNLLAGNGEDSSRKILLPVLPDYIGYMDQLLEPDMIVGINGKKVIASEHSYYYRPDFEAIEARLTEGDIAAMLVSRPANPTGNVLSDRDMDKLLELADQYQTYLILDNAYGMPWPNAIFVEASLGYHPRIIYSFSLSKIGLPMARTGIVIAAPEIISQITQVNAILALSPGNLGQKIFSRIIEEGKLSELVAAAKDYYQAKSELALSVLDKHLDSNLPWKLHQHQGSFFFWLWLDQSKVDSSEFYHILYQNSILSVDGRHFFTPEHHDDPESRQFIRLNFGRPDQEVIEGFELLAKLINTKAY